MPPRFSRKRRAAPAIACPLAFCTLRSARFLVAIAAVVCGACAAPLQRTPVRPSAAANDQTSPRVPREAGRPTVGVAFGGGSARGIAHVGVIHWLEEHRIPIDLAAGTSMGGLVGGAFATGMEAAELRTFVETLDWDQL